MSNTGKIAQVIGPVVDVDFPEAKTPAVYNALHVAQGDGKKITLEVAKHLGAGRVRAIALGATEGLVRGSEVSDTGAPISVPVGKEVLGRLFNVLGEPIDEMGDNFTK